MNVRALSVCVRTVLGSLQERSEQGDGDQPRHEQRGVGLERDAHRRVVVALAIVLRRATTCASVLRGRRNAGVGKDHRVRRGLLSDLPRANHDLHTDGGHSVDNHEED